MLVMKQLKSNIVSLIARVTSWNGVATSTASNLSQKPSGVLFTPDYVMPRPFKALPNISEFKVRPNQLDPLLSKDGIAKKLSPNLESRPLSSRIASANRYIWIVQCKLERLLRQNRAKEFWIFALLLMHRSKVLRAVALRKLDKNWHRSMPLGRVKSMLSQLSRTINTVRTQMKIVRNYVEKVKPDGSLTFRPIGNPAKVDRMYTYLFQSFTVMYSSGYISRSQHAYQPRRGVVTALAEIKTLLLGNEFKYVWEFDLKGAFPSVVIPRAMEVLREIGVPPALVEVYEDISYSSVERVDLAPEPQDIPEPKFEKQELLANALPIFQPGEYDWVESQLLHAGIAWFRERKRILAEIQDPMERFHRLWSMILIGWAEASEERHRVASNKYMDVLASNKYQLAAAGRYPIEELMPKFTHEDLPALVEYRKIVKDRLIEEQKKAALDRARAALDLAQHGKMLAAGGKHPIEVRGFPQGLGLSPVLFNICFEASALRGHFNQLGANVKVVSYADDFLVFSDKNIEEIMNESSEMKEMGLTINREKSRLMCEDSNWIVEGFKFLGITIKPAAKVGFNFYGTPRSGKTLFFDKLNTVERFVARDKELRKVSRLLGAQSLAAGGRKRLLTSQEVLDAWGEGIVPFNRIPLAVIEGERALLPADLSIVRTDSEQTAFLDSDHLTASEKVLVHKHLSGRPLNVLGTRLAGLLVNRLHGGSWTDSEKEDPKSFLANNSIEPLESGKGKSWMDRMLNLRVRVPSLAHISIASMRRVEARLLAYESRNRSFSIYNSTSHATVDLLRMQRDRRHMRCFGKENPGVLVD